VTSETGKLPTLYCDEEGVQIGRNDYDGASPMIPWEDLDEFHDMVGLAKQLKAQITTVTKAR
jgi:hypothetical protein